METVELESIVKEAVRLHLARIGKRGGSVCGASKSRSRAKCQRARRKLTARIAAMQRDFSAMGKCGGALAKGAAKARTTEQARAAALAGVEKRRKLADAAALERGRLAVQKINAAEQQRAKIFRETWFTK